MFLVLVRQCSLVAFVVCILSSIDVKIDLLIMQRGSYFYFQLKIIKIFYWESLLTGSFPLKINEDKIKIEIEYSPLLMILSSFWLISTSLTTAIYTKWLLIDTFDMPFRSKVMWIGLLTLYFYSIGTFAIVCMHSRRIIERLDQIIKLIEINEINSMMSKMIVFEVFNVNVVLLLMDFYAFMETESIYDITDLKFTFAFLSYYPRRFVLIGFLLILHFVSEALRILMNQRQLKADFNFAILLIFKLLMTIDRFVQYALVFNSLMFIKNSYTLCSGLIRVAMSLDAEGLDKLAISFRTALYLPTEMTRLWTIVNCCAEIRKEVRCNINMVENGNLKSH